MGARLYKKQLRCYYNGNDTVFAYDEKDAKKILDKIYGIGYVQEEDEFEEKLDLNEEYTLYQEDNNECYLEPEFGKVLVDTGQHRDTKATLRDWLNVVGRGLLGSEQY